MKKRVLFFITFLTFALVSWAYDIKVGGIYYSVNAQKKTAGVTSEELYHSSYSGKIVIPSSIMFKGVSLKVTSIGAMSFQNCDKLLSVTIPNTVKYIGDKAFDGCKNLTSITIPNSIEEIGEYAFRNCVNLTSITLPQNVTAIGRYAFWGCSCLNTLKIYQNTTSIGELAFCDCKELKKVYLYFVSVPRSSDDIFDRAFVEFATLYVPFGTSSIIKSKSPWNHFSKIVELNDDFSKSLGEKAKQQQKREEEEKRVAEEQARQKEFEENEKIVKKGPEFPGGEVKMFEFIAKNINYPQRARDQGVQGICIIEFYIDIDGSVVEPKVVRSLWDSCDEEAMRVILSMPKWNPAMNGNGKPVREKYTLPIQFRLT